MTYYVTPADRRISLSFDEFTIPPCLILTTLHALPLLAPFFVAIIKMNTFVNSFLPKATKKLRIVVGQLTN